MPLTKEGIVTLSIKELQAIFGLDVFQSQKHLLLEELRTRCNLEPIPFRQVHQAPECQLGYWVLGSRPSGFLDPVFLVDKHYLRLQLECKKHQIRSAIYEDFSFPQDLEQIK